jgi:aspartate aminotransferase
MIIGRRLADIKPSATMALDQRAKEMRREGQDVLSFAIGEPDFPTPANIREAAARAMDAGATKYTEAAGTLQLREAIVAGLERDLCLSYSPAGICVSNGAKHSLLNLCQALVDPGDEVIVISPYWVSYCDLVRLAGGEGVVHETTMENGFQPDPDEVAELRTARTRVLLINSPSNPTGAVIAPETIRRLAQWCVDEDLWLISDEIYDKIIFDGNTTLSPAQVSEAAKERTIIVNGCSKTYSMTGWRIGWTVTPHPPLAKALSSFQSQTTSNPCSISQAAALAALTGPQDSVEAMRQEFQRRRDAIIGGLRQIPDLAVYEPGGAFYAFPKVSAYFGREIKGHRVESALELCHVLLDEGLIACVPGEAFGAPGCLRLSFACSLEQIAEGVKRMGDVLTS